MAAFSGTSANEQDLKKAIGFFQLAIDRDPNYALAYDGLADCWLPLGWYGFLPPSDTFPRARAAIAKALSLDDSMAEAHTSLAFVNMYYDRDWAGAEREFRRAIELNPNYANGHHWYGEYLVPGWPSCRGHRGIAARTGTRSALEHHQCVGQLAVFLRPPVR